MILQTGGLAIGLTSTRSNPNSPAFSRAASMVRTPSCSPAGPTTRTSRARMRRFVLWSRAMWNYLLGVSKNERANILFCYRESSCTPRKSRHRCLSSQQSLEYLERHGFQILSAVSPRRHRAQLDFLVANHQRERDFLDLGLADLRVQGHPALVQLDAIALLSKRIADLPGVVQLAVGNRHQRGLHG